MSLGGATLAVASGTGFSVAAALQRREARSVSGGTLRLLRTLTLRPLWLGALGIELLAWGAEAAAFSIAPIALVIPLMGMGAVVLVVLGVSWLGERFRGVELAGIAAVALGSASAAMGTGSISASRVRLSAPLQVGIAVGALALAVLAFRIGSGIGCGLAAGFLYAATAVYTKEVGDGFALRAAAIGRLLVAPTPWLLIALSIGGLALVQAGFRQANAASVVAAMSAVDSIGPILAGFLLYHEPYPAGGRGLVLGIGLGLAVLGVSLLRGLTEPEKEPARPAV